MELGAAGLSPRGLTAALQRLAEQEGVTIHGEPSRVGTVCRDLTHRSLTFETFVTEVKPVGRETVGSDRRWVTPKALSDLALSTAHRSILSVAQGTLKAL